MANSKSNTLRRQEVRRSLPRPPAFWVRWFSRKGVAWAAVFLLVYAAFSSTTAIITRSRVHYQLNQPISDTVVARVPLIAVDQEKTLEKRRDAFNREPAVYAPNTEYLNQVRERLQGLVDLGKKDSIEQIPAKEREALKLTPKGLAELAQYAQAPEQWGGIVDQFLDGFASIAVLDAERARVERDPSERASKIALNHPMHRDGLLHRNDSVILSIRDDLPALRESVTALVFSRFPRDLCQTVIAVVMQNPKPLYRYDEAQTRQNRQFKYDREAPVEMDYAPNDILVPAGKVLEKLDLQLLRQEQTQYLAQLGPVHRWLARAGWVGIFGLIGLGLWSYILAYTPRIAENPARGLALTAVVLLTQAMAATGLLIAPIYVYALAVFPTLLTTIVLAISYNQRFALAVGATHTLAVLLTLGLPVGFGFVLLTGVTVAVTKLDDVRNRSTLVLVGLWVGLAMAVATLLVGATQGQPHLPFHVKRILTDALLTCLSGFATGLVVQGILPGIERLFGVTTSMTLRELNDASHPLLRRLAQQAPGTYQHSLRIADIAENAADAISADGLLCRVGAMYHDVGKINKPSYFVENQGGGPNRHSKLSPAMSLLIIVGHVKDGIEMAREYGLPQSLRHFIESHHGTTLVEYFYHAAKMQHDEGDSPAPTEFEFRYPGPKPQTKEAAILMICDAIESASRAQAEPTASRLEQLVHVMASKRLMDGQFDECNLTLQELHKIEQSITKTLCAIYHGRVRYPSDKSSQTPEGQPATDPSKPAIPATGTG